MSHLPQTYATPEKNSRDSYPYRLKETMRLIGQPDRSRICKPKLAVVTGDFWPWVTSVGRARRNPRVEAFYPSSYIDYAPSAFKSSSDHSPACGSCLRGRARGVAAAANAGTQLAFWARAGRLIAGDKERPTSWRERGPRLWDLSPEHALSNVRNHHSRRPRGPRVSIFGDPGSRRKAPPFFAGGTPVLTGWRFGP